MKVHIKWLEFVPGWDAFYLTRIECKLLSISAGPRTSLPSTLPLWRFPNISESESIRFEYHLLGLEGH